MVRGAMVWLIGPGPARSHPKRHSRTLHVEPRHVLLSSHSVHLIAHMESVCSPTNVANRLLTSTRGRGVVNLHRSRPPDAANRERMSFCCAASLSSKTPHKRRLPSTRTRTCHNCTSASTSQSSWLTETSRRAPTTSSIYPVAMLRPAVTRKPPRYTQAPSRSGLPRPR